MLPRRYFNIKKFEDGDENGDVTYARETSRAKIKTPKIKTPKIKTPKIKTPKICKKIKVPKICKKIHKKILNKFGVFK